MKSNRTLHWSITVAVAGFLFGFDTVVISGANEPIKDIWPMSDWAHGIFIMSAALWGTVLGALGGGYPTQRLGRKKTLIWIGVLYTVSAIGSALAPNAILFSLFRFIGGVGVGASSVTAPTYISEITTADNRGRLVALYQFNIVLGIFIAFFSNYLIGISFENHAWRWMLGVEALPALIYTVLVMSVPMSPRWLLLKRNDEDGARSVLRQMGLSADGIERSLREIRDSLSSTIKENIFSSTYRKPVVLAFLIAFFNQLSGINFILYYAPSILESAGLGSTESLANSIWIGGINLVFTIIGMYLIDRLGRKQLMYLGSIGYITSLAMVAFAFYTGASSNFLLFFLLMFIASHAIGQGAVIWVFISEIFPNKVRAFGQAWGCGVHWVFAAIITMVGTPVIEFFDNPWPVFAFFSGMMFLQLLFTHFMMPETKGVSLEDLQKRLVE